MLHSILATSFASVAVAGMIGPDAFGVRGAVSRAVSFKRHGAIRFFRIGRLSGSWCISRKPVVR